MAGRKRQKVGASRCAACRHIEALRAVPNDADRLDVDHWWALGDLVLFGPRPSLRCVTTRPSPRSSRRSQVVVPQVRGSPGLLRASSAAVSALSAKLFDCGDESRSCGGEVVEDDLELVGVELLEHLEHRQPYRLQGGIDVGVAIGEGLDDNAPPVRSVGQAAHEPFRFQPVDHPGGRARGQPGALGEPSRCQRPREGENVQGVEVRGAEPDCFGGCVAAEDLSRDVLAVGS